jgi:hypothetical protein
MRIHEFVWDDERIDHIARHGITPEEVEEVCFGQAFVRRGRTEGKNPVYYVLGETHTGRHLFCVGDSVPGRKWLPGDRSVNVNQREAPIPAMEETMTARRLPRTDSIQDLAKFWDTHDLTDYEAELTEVDEPVFERGDLIKVHLPPKEVKALEQIAESKGVSLESLIRDWVRQRLSRRKVNGSTRAKAEKRSHRN